MAYRPRLKAVMPKVMNLLIPPTRRTSSGDSLIRASFLPDPAQSPADVAMFRAAATAGFVSREKAEGAARVENA